MVQIVVGDCRKIEIDRKEVLGCGSFAAVFKGTFNDKKVAVKRTQIHYMNERKSPHYERELKFMEGSTHKNIVRYLYDDKDEDFFYIVMELCEFSLCDYFNEHGYGITKTREVLLKILFHLASGLTYLHDKNILHRDVKTRNSLISMSADEITIKLTDFGISEVLDAPSTTLTSAIKDAFGYKAPEVKQRVRSKQSDIFSLGIVFHVCAASGNHPYGENELDAQNKINKQEEPTISDSIESSLKLLIEEMILNESDKRPDGEKVKCDLCDMAVGVDLESPIRSSLFKRTQPRATNPDDLTEVDESASNAGKLEQCDVDDAMECNTPTSTEERYGSPNKITVPCYKHTNCPLGSVGHGGTESVKLQILDLNGRFDSLPKLCDNGNVRKYFAEERSEYVAVKRKLGVAGDVVKDLEIIRRNLRHENIITLYRYLDGLLETENVVYIVMELCDEENLQDIVIKDKLPRDTKNKIEILRQVAEGLSFMHDKGILHQDLKPSNILRKGKVFKISDFGMSKILPADASITVQSVPNIETDGWRAPETSSDILSLGLVFYFTLSGGKHPFSEEADLEIGDTAKPQCRIDCNENANWNGIENLDGFRLIKDTVQEQLNNDPASRPNISSILKHPLFWSCEEKVQFYSKITKYFQLQGTKKNMDVWPAFDDRESKYGGDVIPKQGFRDILLLNEKEQVKFGAKDIALVSRVRRLDFMSVSDLIRLMRNRHVHMAEDIHSKMYERMTEEDLCNLFESRFPYLLLYSYYKAKKILEDPDCDDIVRTIFCDFL